LTKIRVHFTGRSTLGIERTQHGCPEPLFLQESQRRKNQFGPEHPHTIDMLNQLVSLYEAWDKPEKAEEWRAKLPQTEAVEESNVTSCVPTVFCLT
jgi:hypothetical protein